MSGTHRRFRFAVVTVFLALAASPFASAAPTQTISGTVVDVDGKGLVGVQVTLRGQPNDPVLTVKTKKKGKFFFGLVKSDYPYTLEIGAEDLGVKSFHARALDDERKLRDEFTEAGAPDGPLRAVRVPVGGSVVVEIVMMPRAAIDEAILGSKLQPILAQIDGGDYAGAGAALDELLAEAPDEPRLLYLSGFAMMRGGDPGAAVAPLEKAAEIDPGLDGVHAALGAALAETGDFSAAEAAFAREAEGDADLATRVNARVGQAEAARRRGDDRAALAALEQALALAPERPDVLSLLAETHARLGDEEAAAEAMAKAESLGGGDPVALYNLAARFMNEGQYEKALENFRRAVALDASLTQSHYHMGIALINLQRVEEAREELQTFLDANPEGAEAENARSLVDMLEPSEKGS